MKLFYIWASGSGDVVQRYFYFSSGVLFVQEICSDFVFEPGCKAGLMEIQYASNIVGKRHLIEFILNTYQGLFMSLFS